MPDDPSWPICNDCDENGWRTDKLGRWYECEHWPGCRPDEEDGEDGEEE